jgi:flagellar protein FliS
MFSSPALARRQQHFANAYRQVGTETGVAGADAHQLVAMLFDGCLAAIARARGAMRSGQIEAKGQAIVQAVRIVDEGLRSCLNLTAGGPLAQSLHDLYGYLLMRLTLANLRNDEAVLEECQRLLQPLREAWMSIADQASPSARG